MELPTNGDPNVDETRDQAYAKYEQWRKLWPSGRTMTSDGSIFAMDDEIGFHTPAPIHAPGIHRIGDRMFGDEEGREFFVEIVLGDDENREVRRRAVEDDVDELIQRYPAASRTSEAGMCAAFYLAVIHADHNYCDGYDVIGIVLNVVTVMVRLS